MSIIVMEVPPAKVETDDRLEYFVTYHKLPDLQQVFGPRHPKFHHKLAARSEAMYGWVVRHNHTKIISVVRNHLGEVDNVFYLGEPGFPY